MALVVRWCVTGPFRQNSYLLVDDRTREAVLVDPGDDADDIAALVERERATVKAIYLTHCHIDHVGAVADLQERYGVPTFAPTGDRGWLEALPEQAHLFRLGERRVPKVDGDLVDGQRIAFGTVEGAAIATPGHTEGGTCLWFPADRVLVTGDTLFVGSVGRTDLPGGDFATLATSIRDRLFTLPADVTFYAGHGEPGRLDDEKVHNPFVGAQASGGGIRTPRMP
jgi:hydroxyacylglutathione hydrolase